MIAAREVPVHLPEPLIRQVANNLVGRFSLTESDREDIEQFLRKRVVKAWPAYDPKRSQPNTFADRVIDAATASFIRDRTRMKRDPSRVQPLDGCGYEPTTDRHDAHRLDLEMDVRIGLDGLDANDRAYALLLMDYGPVEAQRRSGLTKRKAESARKRIRQALIDGGLDRYVTNNWERN